MTLYHYTSVGALVDGVLPEHAEPGKEICLRATHVNYMNDPLELEKGKELLRKYLKLNNASYTEEELQQLYSEIYSISFSKNEDSIPMWSMYGGNSGIALQFELDDDIISDRVNDDTTLLRECFYDAKKYACYFMLISNVRGAPCDAIIAYAPLLLKNKDFEYENEWRIVGEFADAIIKYRHKNGIIIPYKELFLPKSCLTRIKVGPTANFDFVKASLLHFLKERGFESVEIVKSTAPLRKI